MVIFLALELNGFMIVSILIMEDNKTYCMCIQYISVSTVLLLPFQKAWVNWHQLRHAFELLLPVTETF